MSYKLHFEKLGRGDGAKEIIVDDFNEFEMNKCQRYLMSRDWEWMVDIDNMKGVLYVGFCSFPFTIEKIGD